MDMISPGIYTQIVDLSTYLNSTSGTIGFVPVLTEQGEDNTLIKVTGTTDYITRFGEPDIRQFGKYYSQGPYVATQHLAVSNDLYVLRALPDDATYAHALIAFAKVPAIPAEYREGTGEYDETTTGLTCFSVDAGTKVAVLAEKPTNAEDGKTYYMITADTDSILAAIKASVAYSVDEETMKYTLIAATETDTTKAKITTDKAYALIKTVGGMSSTQVLDAYLSGNDDVLLGVTQDKGIELYDQDKAHNSVLAYVRAIGRGDYYDSLKIKITSDANPAKFGSYNFQVFQEQDGSDVMIESYSVSFDPTALDADGESLFIEDIVNKFSSWIRISVNKDALKIMQDCMMEFYQNDPTIEQVTTEYTVDEGFPALVPEFVTGEAPDGTITGSVINVVKPDNLGYKAGMIWDAYLKKANADLATFTASSEYNEIISKDDDYFEQQGKNRDEAILEAVENMKSAREETDIASDMFTWAECLNMMNMSDSDKTMAGEQAFPMIGGSLGSLVQTKNGVRTTNSAIATQILCQAYTGLLKNPVVQKIEDPVTGNFNYETEFTSNVFDTDWIYFTIVYDAGYKSDVKQAALDLVDTYRRDCVLISDVGDNVNCTQVLKYVGTVKGGTDVRPWNSYLAARYEPYSRVYDKFTGTDIWVSPVYHMAKLLPQTDALYNIWYAAAGFKRGTVSEVKQLRWSPNKSERDSLYQAQVNPIVHFPEGMTVFGQLTTQKVASTLSDLNCVRCVLYIKRAIEQFCRSFIFDHNDAATHDAIKNGITPLLDQVQAARGLSSYSIDVGATDYEYKTKTCHVNVTLAPVKVLEKIQLNMFIQ